MEFSKTLRQIKAYANKKQLPLIPICSKGITLLDKPDSFYNSILSNTKTVQNRLLISTLYLGTGSKELALVQSICDKVANSKYNLEINIVLDANRARRLDGTGQSSKILLERLSAYSHVNIRLIDVSTNNTIVGRLLSRFQKWNEISSTYHSKVLVFDDQVLITGANLSSIYFEKRQDRYMLIKGSKLLSNYVNDLIKELGERENFGEIISKHNLNCIRQSVTIEDNDTESYVIPLIQCGPSNISHKEDFLTFLDSILTSESNVYLSSGYFNPSQVVNKMRINSVLAPSEAANGFYNGGGLLKYIPRLYSALYKQYIDTHHQCKFHLYDKLGWSFHAKGMWVEELDNLYIHLIGSSNFNCRSAERDFELQLLLITRNKELIAKLKMEREALWAESRQVVANDLTGLNLIFQTMSKIFRSFL